MVMRCGFQSESHPHTHHYIYTLKVHPLQGQREDVPLHPILNVISEIILCSCIHLFPGIWMLGIYAHPNRNCPCLTAGAPKIIIPEEDS